MSLLYLLLSFGGGVFAAMIGALGAFVFCGFAGIVGVGIIIASGDATFLNEVAFGPYFGPHIAFAGGVAAAAYAGNKKKLLGDNNGSDIATPMFGSPDPMVLFVGGIFGSLGYVLQYVFSSVIAIPTDTVALSVVASGVIVRLLFGTTGILGTFTSKNGSTRKWTPDVKSFVFLLIGSAGLGLLVADMAIMFNVAAIGFVFSAASLIFASIGLPVPATHHITLVAGVAAVTSGNVYVGMLFAVIAMIVGEFFTLTFNSHHDSHIDAAAGSIAIVTAIFMVIY